MGRFVQLLDLVAIANQSAIVSIALGAASLGLILALFIVLRSQRRLAEARAQEQEVLRKNRQLQFLNAISKVASQSFDVEEILQNAAEQLLGLFSAETGGVWLLEDDGRTLRRRGSTGAMLTEIEQVELPQEYVNTVRQKKIEFISERDLQQVPQSVARLIQSANIKSMMCAVLWTAENPTGVLSVGSCRKNAFDDSDRALLVALGRQLATTLERVRLYHNTRHAYDHLQLTQEQLLQSEKLRAMGQLVSGVAHELNNPLTALVGYAELMLEDKLDDVHRDYVGKMLKQALRMQRLVQNLLSFARQRTPEKSRVELRSVLEDALALRDFDIKRQGIVVQTSFDDALPAAYGDAQQLEQVFLNIINNAMDAAVESATPRRIEVRAMLEEGRLCAEVRDSGPGIKEPARVFDPFYTTKPVGRGTGLGLSICYGIIKEHGGEMTVRNHPEGGAIFRVYLPVVAVPVAPAILPRVHRTSQLEARILVVDHELAVRDFEREVLVRCGAQVVAASTGDEALARLELDKFDAVLLDTALPGRWSGPEIYRWIASNRPGTERNIVFACADISEPGVQALLKESRIPYLQKPFQADDLVEVLQAVVAQHRRTVSG